MNRLLLPLALAFGIAAQSVSAAALLRPNIVVDGDVVKLGDLFDNIGDKADIAVARSPAPGRRATLDADWLQRMANIHGVDWHSQNAFEQAVVERASMTVTHDQIEAELLSALVGQGVQEGSQIELANRMAQIVVPVGVSLQIGVRDLFYDSRNRRFTATVEVPANSPSATRIRVAGRVFQTIEIPVLTRQINRGEVIAARDLTWTKVREDSVRRDVATDPSQIIGMTPRQTVRSGQMVSISDVQKPIAVTRGGMVTMVLKNGAMSLSAQGHAVEQGSVGDVIRVTNSQSNLTVEAKVEGPNMVSVSLNGTAALAN
jgi:flagella basal body P-ring formation protein FlgA